ncbi:prefoldin alpha subunit [Klebsormidium nitens]|uniref:Prefoldin alpha subunit n=1 Tax=Klebsormidium nitens TaxID=105231 RepID=A0A1Y1ID73_KLENI|nr:prefoldin alpha subunit [Klebsormidium nitens]|eukprot:GAQ86677.1 prefoldin alpha subunit [Klebsormidium nitens]
MAEQQQIPVTALTVEQLKQVKDTLEAEIQVLSDSIRSLQVVIRKFDAAAGAVDDLSTQTSGKPALIPLTGSLFVPATLASVEKVLVDVGTGYYVEKTLTDGKDYCTRRVKYLEDKLRTIGDLLGDKQKNHSEVSQVIQMKLSGQGRQTTAQAAAVG